LILALTLSYGLLVGRNEGIKGIAQQCLVCLVIVGRIAAQKLSPISRKETAMQPPELLDRDAVCRFFGGTRPINPATLYRGVRKGR
jgi:hypothetical protein